MVSALASSSMHTRDYFSEAYWALLDLVLAALPQGAFHLDRRVGWGDSGGLLQVSRSSLVRVMMATPTALC
jgi:hypothetical protein